MPPEPPELLDQIPPDQEIASVTADGDFETRKCHDAIAARGAAEHAGHAHTKAGLVAIFMTAVYGGYFGAAQGIILTAVLGIFLNDHLQRLNACKNVLALTVNTVAAVLFIATTSVDWKVVGCIAVGSTIGGQIGATYGRKLDPRALRALIVVVGLTALVRLL